MSKEHRIGVRALRAQLAHVLNEVAQAGQAYIVERDGKPVAALVPLELYRRVARAAGVAEGRAPYGTERVTGPYDALLALAGTMPSDYADVGRHKHRHLAEIYAKNRR